MTEFKLKVKQKRREAQPDETGVEETLYFLEFIDLVSGEFFFSCQPVLDRLLHSANKLNLNEASIG